MKVRFVFPADIELDEAIEYYESQLPGLGLRFYAEISGAIHLIKYMPKAWTKIGKQTRRYLIKGFPYAILYVAEPEEILIVAIAHLHRNPEHFKNRIQ